MTRARLVLSIGAASVLLSACATPGDPDPHKSGIIDGVRGLSGGYQRRLDERQVKLDELAQQKAELQRRLAEAQSARRQEAAHIEDLNRQIRALEASTRESRRKLDDLVRTHSMYHNQEVELMASWEAVERELAAVILRHNATGAGDASPAPPIETELQNVQELQAKQKRFDAAIDAAIARQSARGGGADTRR